MKFGLDGSGDVWRS